GPGARGWPGADGEAGLVAARCCRRGPGRGRSDVGSWTAGEREAGCGKWGAWGGEWERGAGRAWSGEWERGAGGAWSGEWERGAGGAGGAGEPHAEVRGVGLTLLMLTPELAGRADLREGCPYGKAEKVHAGVPSGGGGAGAGYGSADRARGRGDRRGCATAGSLGPAGTRAARSASEPGDAFDRPGAGG